MCRSRKEILADINDLRWMLLVAEENDLADRLPVAVDRERKAITITLGENAWKTVESLIVKGGGE